MCLGAAYPTYADLPPHADRVAQRVAEFTDLHSSPPSEASTSAWAIRSASATTTSATLRVDRVGTASEQEIVRYFDASWPVSNRTHLPM
jgi:hypothetical protein